MAKSSDTLARLRARSIEAGRFVLPLETAWADKINEAQAAVRRAELVPDEDRAQRVAEAQAAVDALAESAGDKVLVFRMKRLSRAEYDALVTRNPPSPEQRKEDEDKPRTERRIFNEDTFGPELVSMVCYDPPLTPEEALAIIHGVEGEDASLALSKGESEAFMWAAQSAALSPPKQVPKELKLP